MSLTTIEGRTAFRTTLGALYKDGNMGVGHRHRAWRRIAARGGQRYHPIGAWRSVDAVADVALGRQLEHGTARPCGTDLVDNFETLLLEKHGIEDDRVVLFGPGKEGALSAVRGDVGGRGFGLQSLLQERGDLPLVL
jgi:hypothetical protein